MNAPLFACVACGLLMSLANLTAAYPQKAQQHLSLEDIRADLTVILSDGRFSTRIEKFLKVLNVHSAFIVAEAVKLDADNVLTQTRIEDIEPHFKSHSRHLNAEQKYRIAHLLPSRTFPAVFAVLSWPERAACEEATTR